MATKRRNTKLCAVEVLAGEHDLIKEAMKEVLEDDMSEFWDAESAECSEGRCGVLAAIYMESRVATPVTGTSQPSERYRYSNGLMRSSAGLRQCTSLRMPYRACN